MVVKVDLLQEYQKRVAEANADWETYCKNPTDSNWKNYEASKRLEMQTYSKLSREQRDNIFKND